MDNEPKSSSIASALLTLLGVFLCGIVGLFIISFIAIWGGGRLSDLVRNLYYSPGTWVLLSVLVRAGQLLGQYFYKKMDYYVSSASTRTSNMVAVMLWIICFVFVVVSSIRLWK